MAEKLKKKPSFFKRWNSRGEISKDGRSTPPSPSPQALPPAFKSQNYASLSRATGALLKPRKLSAGGINDLVQCPLCLEVLHNPKMLPCQHTFCLACLTVYISDQPIIDCPICHTRIQVQGPGYVNSLPSNLYIDSLLSYVGINNDSDPKSSVMAAPSTPVNGSVSVQSVELFAGGTRCSQCKTMCDTGDVSCCEHCKMSFCRLCWSQHLDDMRTQIGSILKQLSSAANRLEHKMEHFKDRCEHITDQINIAAEEKITAIIEAKDKLLEETLDLQKTGDLTALALKSSLEEAKEVATREMEDTNNDDEKKAKDKRLKETLDLQKTGDITALALKSSLEEEPPVATWEMEDTNNDDERKVTTFVNLHQNALQILSEVSKWDTDHFVFDKEGFRIEVDSATPLDAESDDPIPDGAKQNDPLENEESLFMHYRSRTFVPHYVWRKASRPGGVAISPWSGHLYVCGMDIHCVLVVERSQAKIVGRLTHEDMLCPVQIAFMKSLGEIYVTDKWKHCIHVFSKEGEFLRTIGQKGSRVGMFRSPEGIATDNASQLLYVVDTGNDRVQVLQPDGKYVDVLGVATKQQPVNTTSVWATREVTCTELNAPTSVAVTSDRVVILDSGNKRIKIYNKENRSKIVEFGAMGQSKGQFRQPEVLTVDPLGFILVGDSGNCRVQVFKQNGQLVRVFGGLGSAPGRFGWISGIYVTKQLDVIISDTKNHCVNFF